MQDGYEYRAIPAPTRAVRVKGLKTTSERFAHLLTEALNEMGREGWEFLRTETLPCEERKGLTGTRTVTTTLLIFRRGLPSAAAPAQPPVPRLRPVPSRPGPDADPGEDRLAERLDPAPAARAEPLLRPGALLRAEGARRFPPLRRDGAGAGPAGDEPGERG